MCLRSHVLVYFEVDTKNEDTCEPGPEYFSVFFFVYCYLLSIT